MDYKKTATTCDSALNNILKMKDEKIGKDHIALALLLRYLKRINAHLKNIASSVVNPFHRIGYKVKK
jgi:phosphate uptake regulator